MNVLTEFSMPLSAKSYKYFVTGEDCQVVAKQAIKQLLEETMETVSLRIHGIKPLWKEWLWIFPVCVPPFYLTAKSKGG